MSAAAAAVGALPAMRSRRRALAVAVIAAGATALWALLLLPSALDAPGVAVVERLLVAPTGGPQVWAGIRYDGLAAVVAVMVSAVALAVQVYSAGSLHADRRYSSYAWQVSLFTAAMLLVVVSSDLFELLVGWEVMGLCSYLLIGHYRGLEQARSAALKAFLVTRIGDVGLLLGIVVLVAAAGTSDIGELLAAVPTLPHSTVVVGSLLLLLGVAGKSAQFPLQVWLPDAMVGPTPISALIHAATMVAAGVYLVARLLPLFLASVVTLDALAVMAAITMVLGAYAALAQRDLKRMLAWSTVSQLAYMLAALAVGGYAASLLHLLVHASAKALLFLAAGLLLHAAGTGDLAQLRGVGRRVPAAGLALALGALTLAGVPPLAGAWSKDAVLGALTEAAAGHGPGPDRPFAIGLAVAGYLTVALTAAYLTRLLVVLLGPPPARGLEPTPETMTQVVNALSVTTAAAALLALPPALPRWLPAPAGAREHLELGGPVLLVAIALTAAAAGAVWWAMDRGGRDPLTEPSGRVPAIPAVTAAREGFGFDRAYAALVVRPVRAAAAAVGMADGRLLDAGAMGLAGGVRRTAELLRWTARGRLRGYLAGLAGGVLLLVLTAVVT